MQEAPPIPTTDLDLVAAWIGGAAGRRAGQWLQTRGGLGAILDVPYREARREVGSAAALRLLAAAEVVRRVRSRFPKPGDRIATSRDVAAIYGPRLAAEPRERFLALALDAKNRVRAEIEIAVGTLSSCPVHPREAFRPLVRESASAVVFVHNHPSGDPTPSEEDREITERLRAAGTLLGIRVLDHVIVGAEGSWSFTEGARMAW